MNKLMNLLGAIEIKGDELNVKTMDEIASAIVSLISRASYLVAVIAFGFLSVQIVKIIIADGQEKMQHIHTAKISAIALVIFFLLPSIINWVMSFFT